MNDTVNDDRINTKGIAEIKLAQNKTPTGELVISVDVKVGETITIDYSNIVDLDNFDGYTPTFNYSWETSTDQGNSWTVLTSSDATDNNQQLTITEDD